MQGFIEKLIGRLEEEQNKQEEFYHKVLDDGNLLCIYDASDMTEAEIDEIKKVIQIVNQLAEEHKGGWIPCSERLPDDGVKVLCYGKSALGRMRYEVSFYSHSLEWWNCSSISYVLAWQPLPEPYIEK